MDAMELDQLMRRWAASQHSLVCRDQFVEHGLDPRAARRRIVVTLSPPRAGHCYKVVAALL